MKLFNKFFSGIIKGGSVDVNEIKAAFAKQYPRFELTCIDQDKESLTLYEDGTLELDIEYFDANGNELEAVLAYNTKTKRIISIKS